MCIRRKIFFSSIFFLCAFLCILGLKNNVEAWTMFCFSDLCFQKVLKSLRGWLQREEPPLHLLMASRGPKSPVMVCFDHTILVTQGQLLHLLFKVCFLGNCFCVFLFNSNLQYDRKPRQWLIPSLQHSIEEFSVFYDYFMLVNKQFLAFHMANASRPDIVE